MNISSLKRFICASGLLVSAAAIAQEPFTPATAGRLTADATSSIMVKVDGSRVIDATGQPLGRIENIVLSPVGCAEAAILTAANGRLIPIPWSFVRASGDTRVAGAMPGANMVFTVNLDNTRLTHAPSFTRSQWPDMSNQNWLQASINFFGTGSTNAVGATGGGTNAVTGAGASSTLGGSTNQNRFPANTTGSESGATLPPPSRPGQTPDFQPTTPPAPPAVPPTQPNNPPPSDTQRPGNPGTTPGTTPGTPPPSRPPGTIPPSSPSSRP